MWKLNILTPKGTSLAQNTSTKRRMVTIRPPVRLVGEPKKTKKKERKEERHPKQWQTGYSPRPPTSSDQNQTLHGGWPALHSYTCQVWSKSVKGLRRCGGSKMSLSYYFGQWLIQQLVLPYKPWSQETDSLICSRLFFVLGIWLLLGLLGLGID